MNGHFESSSFNVESPYCVWLASFPKSGNTWLRLLLGAYFQGGNLSVFSEALESSCSYATRKLLDDALGFDTSDLSKEAIHHFRIEVFKWLAKRRSIPRFVKIHDALYLDENRQPAIPFSVTDRAVYLLRNPLDIVHSFAHHSGASQEKIADWFNQDDFSMMEWQRSITNQVPQQVFNWSMHVEGWIEQKEFPVLWVRYEDMVADPVKAFSKIIAFLDDGNVDHDKLKESINACDFKRMRDLEAVAGFYEAPSSERPFFRAGKVGEWRELLLPEVVDCIVEKHSRMMQRFGYL